METETTDKKPWVTANWEKLQEDVTLRIRLMKEIFSSDEIDDEQKEIIWTDVALPSLISLAEFCSSVEIEQPEQECV